MRVLAVTLGSIASSGLPEAASIRSEGMGASRLTITGVRAATIVP
jgi:hypothetical protein